MQPTGMGVVGEEEAEEEERSTAMYMQPRCDRLNLPGTEDIWQTEAADSKQTSVATSCRSVT